MAATKVATSKNSTPIVKIFYFRDNPRARVSLFKHPESVNILAPQTYSVNKDGMLSGTIDPIILAFAQENNIKVMPLVTNGSFSKSIAESILADSTKQDLMINALVTEAEKQKYYGWQIDFEGMNFLARDQFSAFIKKAGPIFKEHNLIFSVAVIAQTSSNPSDYPKNLWARVIGVYDYSSLASSADFISVMSYDDPDSAGPVSPYPWLKKVLNYSLQFIPAEKLSLGIPLYYWEWNDSSGKLIDVGGDTSQKNISKKHHVVTGYSTVNQTAFLKYTFKRKHYTLWYENKKSIAKKIDLINKYKLQGFSAWVLGLENPSVYAAF